MSSKKDRICVKDAFITNNRRINGVWVGRHMTITAYRESKPDYPWTYVIDLSETANA